MLKMNIQTRFFRLPLVTVLFTLLALLFAHIGGNYSIHLIKKNSSPDFYTQVKIPSQFIGLNRNPSGSSDELICEEKTDDETKENHITRSSFSYDLWIHFIKPNETLSSKEFVYFNSNGNYKTSIPLYAFLCSWKDFLA
jgi:hypothetical protein